MSKHNDRVLRIFHEVLGLDRLHYGMWQSEDDLTIKNLRKAQERYETYLIEHIPDSVGSVLDVGCGTGVMSRSLLDRGYAVEGLSPDIHQKEIFTGTVDAPFHHTTFEAYAPTRRHNCLIMSESAQYIALDQLFARAGAALREDGYLMVCDYFVRPGASGVLAKSGHPYEAFMQRARSSGFVPIAERDITDSVTKTLDLANDYAQRLLRAADIGTERTRQKHPHLARFALWAFRKRIRRIQADMELLDSDKFKQNKRYAFLLFQVDGRAR